jgi:extradiol dioxygenase family protein
MNIDHVAVQTHDIAATAQWYVEQFGAQVLYQDSSWAFLKLGGTKLALVKPEQHPAHVAVSVTEQELRNASEKTGVRIDTHRDGTKGIYIKDPGGNAVELICYPPGETVYAKKE